jgi:hypothetical protein
LRYRGFIGDEEAFQPADKSAGLFLRLSGRCRCLIRLMRTRLEFPFVAARLARFEPSRLTRITAAFAGLPRFARLVGAAFTAAFTTFATIAGWLECPTFVAALSR